MSQRLRGCLFISAAAFFWGLAATVGRAAFTGRLHTLSVGFIDPLILSQSRVTFSCLVLLLFLLPHRGSKLFQLQAADVWRMSLLGVFGLAAANYFYYLAIQKTNVATAITVQYTAPVWVLFYMAVRGEQRATPRRLAAVALCVIGIAAAIGLFSHAGMHLDPIGISAALLAAFSCAFYNISGHRLMTRHDHWTVVFYLTLAASLFWLLLNPPWKVVTAHYSATQWLFLAFFAVISMLIPFSFYFAGLQLLDPTTAIVASCLEPVFAISIAAVALGETVRILQIMGMIMVLAGIVLVQLPDARHKNPTVMEPLN